jgi:hypothetical protein
MGGQVHSQCVGRYVSRSLCVTERHISTRARNVPVTTADRARRALHMGALQWQARVGGAMARRAATHLLHHRLVFGDPFHTSCFFPCQTVLGFR